MSIDGSYQYFFELQDADRVFAAIGRISKPASPNNRLIIEQDDGSTIECRFQYSVLIDLSNTLNNKNRRYQLANSRSKQGKLSFLSLDIEVACEIDGLGDYFDLSEQQVFRRQSDRTRIVFLPLTLDISSGVKYVNIGFSASGTIACAMMDDQADSFKSKIEGVYAYGNGVLALRKLEGPYEFLDAAETGECLDYNDSECSNLDVFVDRYRVPKV